jgi:hypothetical protein
MKRFLILSLLLIFSSLVFADHNWELDGKFRIMDDGNIAIIRSVPYSWPTTSQTGYLNRDGSGNLKFQDVSGGGTPSDTVTGETSFGQSSNAGALTTYSRGDHTHGTPTNPVPGHESSYNHLNLPSTDQKNALQGTNGTPSDSNRYVTNLDPRNSDARSPTIHGSSAHTGTIGTWAQIDKTISNISEIATRSHTSLSDIGTNTHSQIDTHIGSTSNPHSTTASQIGLGSVTNDAQLKRADGDFNSFTQKATPVANDVLLIEDSAASYAKKKILWSQLPAGGGGGDNISINGTAATDANFNDTTPPALVGDINIKWQKDTSTPNNISAYISPNDLLDAIRRKPFIFTDFLGPAGAATIEAAQGWDFAIIASGTQAKIAGESNHPGILRVSSSTTTNSGGYCVLEATAFRITGGEIFEVIFQHRVASGTNTTLRMGFLDTVTSADATDGIYFETASSSLALVGKTSQGSTRSTTPTIYTLTVNVWYRAKIIVNSNATSVTFYLYDDSGSLLGSQSLSTNIPTGVSQQTGCGFVVTNVGTTAVLLAYFDWMATWFNDRALTR